MSISQSRYSLNMWKKLQDIVVCSLPHLQENSVKALRTFSIIDKMFLYLKSLLDLFSFNGSEDLCLMLLQIIS